jgi:hypothetical protein
MPKGYWEAVKNSRGNSVSGIENSGKLLGNEI